MSIKIRFTVIVLAELMCIINLSCTASPSSRPMTTTMALQRPMTTKYRAVLPPRPGLSHQFHIQGDKISTNIQRQLFRPATHTSRLLPSNLNENAPFDASSSNTATADWSRRISNEYSMLKQNDLDEPTGAVRQCAVTQMATFVDIGNPDRPEGLMDKSGKRRHHSPPAIPPSLVRSTNVPANPDDCTHNQTGVASQSPQRKLLKQNTILSQQTNRRVGKSRNVLATSITTVRADNTINDSSSASRTDRSRTGGLSTTSAAKHRRRRNRVNGEQLVERTDRKRLTTINGRYIPAHSWYDALNRKRREGHGMANDQFLPPRKRLMGIFRCHGWGPGCSEVQQSSRPWPTPLMTRPRHTERSTSAAVSIPETLQPGRSLRPTGNFEPFFTLTSGGTWGPTGRRRRSVFAAQQMYDLEHRQPVKTSITN